MLDLKTTSQKGVKPEASGEFASIDGVRFYVIRDVDKMPTTRSNNITGNMANYRRCP